MVTQKAQKSAMAGCVASTLHFLAFTVTAALVLMLGMGAAHNTYPEIPAPGFLAAWGGMAAIWALLRVIRVALALGGN